MANLQQVHFQYLDNIADPCSQNDRVVTSMHRRSGIIVTYAIGHGIFEFYECKQWNDLRWKLLGTWSATTQFEKVIRIIGIESYDVFAVLGTNQSGTSVALVGFDGVLRSCVKISNGIDLVSADYNQKTREFIAAFQSGIIICLFMKVISKTEYHLTRRRSTKFGTSDMHDIIVQTIIQDLVNNVLILTKKGHILCLGIDRFDVVFSLSSDLFSIKPTKLIVDKFGTDFLVQSTNSETNKEQLEYWHPPPDYSTCRDNIFSRITIPLSAQILGVSFESLGLFGAKTLLSITTLNKKIQLWSTSAESTLLFEADLKLNNPPHLWQDTQTLLNAGRLSQDSIYSTLHLHCAVQVFLPMPKMDDLTYMTLLLTTVGKSTTFVGIHTTDQVENAMSLAIMDLEIRRMQDQYLISQQHNPSSTSKLYDNPSISIMPSAEGENFNSSMLEQDGLFSLHGGKSESVDHGESSLNRSDALIRSSPLSTGRRTPVDPTIPVGSFASLENPEDSSSGAAFSLQKFGRDVKITSVPAHNNSLQVYPNVETRYFFPSCYIANRDISMCDQKYASGNVVNRLVYPNCVYTDKSDDLYTFNLCGLHSVDFRNPKMLPDVVPVKLFSFANRAEHVLIVSEVKDCLLYNLHVLNTPPLRIPISLRLQAKITVAVCCDAILKSPAPLVQVSAKSRIPGAQKFLADVENIFTMIIMGDDQGFVHIFICDSAKKVLQSDMFLAHSSAITHIVPTGDCCRPLWLIGSEFSDSNMNVTPLCIPGSAFVTVSREGEFKTWLPQGSDSKGTSYDRFFLGNALKWKLCGVFTSLQGTSVLNSYATTYERLTENLKKQKTVETVVLAPSCMNILIGYNNGFLEEWHIPGLIDTCDSVLSTSQRPIWSTILHSDCINSCRVHAHSSLSMVKEVTFPSDKDRDKILASLTSYVRVSNRVRRTIGITFQEGKLLAGSSSVVTCSNDRSLLLWGLQATFFQHCSFLHPVPCKKFYFSSVPMFGIAFCLNTQSSTPNSPHNVWRLDSILEGRLVTVLSEFRGRMFQSFDKNAIEDHRIALGNSSYVLTFDDDLLFEFSRPATGTSKRKSLSAIPVVGHVSKASVLVGCYQMYNDAFRVKAQDSKAVYPYLLSAGLLEDWAKVVEHLEHPVVSSVQFTEDEKDNHIPLDIDWKEVFDPELIPPRPRTPINFAEYTVQKSAAVGITGSVVPPLQPSTLNIEIDNIANYPDPTAFSPMKKFTHNGFHLEVKAESLEKTIAFLEQAPNAKFVLDKYRNSSPSSLRSSPMGHESEPIFPIRRYDFPASGDKSVISFNDELTISTAAMVREDSRELDNLDAVTIRTADENNENQSPLMKDDAILQVRNLEILNNKQKDKDDNHSVITDESSDRGKEMVQQTRSSQLRQLTMLKAKERMDLVDSYNGPRGFGDSRKATKSYYTSKNTILNEDNKQFQGGTRQPLGTNSFFAPPANTSVAKAGIIVPNSIKETPEKPVKKSSAQLVPDIPGVDGLEQRSLTPPPTAEPGKLYYARDKIDDKQLDGRKSAPVIHQTKPSVTPPEEAKQKFVVQKASKPRAAKPLAPRKHPAGHGHRGVEIVDAGEKKSVFTDDEESIQSSLVSLQSDEPAGPIPTSPEGVPLYHRPGINNHVSNPAVKKEKILDEVSSNHALKHHPAIAPVPGPQSLFLDLPDQRMLKRRRHAMQLAKNLAERGVNLEDTPLESLAAAAQSKESQNILNNAADDTSVVTTGTEESQVSTYFDRKAKPIFVERKKSEKAQSKSRKSPPKTPTSPKRLVNNESDDESTSSSKIGGVDVFMQGMTDEDRLLFEGLDEEARKKLMEDMKNAKMAGKGQNKMLKQLAKKALEDAKENALLNMDLTIEPLEISDLCFTVSISSLVGGSIYVVLVKAASATPLSHTYFSNEKTILGIPGYHEHRMLALAANSFEEVSFENLRPSTQYIVLAFVNLNSLVPMDIEPEKITKKDKPSSAKKEIFVDTSKITNWWNLDIETKEEQFDIEWDRLDLDMRVAETRAALRNEFVQAKAYYHFPSIILPTDEEVQSNDFKALLVPNLDLKNIASLKKKLKGHLVIFYEWWVGQEKAKVATKIRSEFQSLECIHAILHHKQFLQAFEEEGYCTKEESQLLTDYVKKNTNQKSKLHNSASTSIAANSVADSGQRMKSTTSNISIDAESASTKSGFAPGSTVSAGSVAFNEKGLHLMKLFRSWYKGGQVVKDKEELNMRMASQIVHEDDLSVTSTTSESSLRESGQISLTHQRLVERTDFLTELIESVDEAMYHVNKLWESYKIAVTKSFRESDLIYERANLSPKDLITITSAKKFLELCLDYSMLSSDMETAFTTATTNPRTNRNETPQYRSIDLSALDAYHSLLKLNPSLANADYITTQQSPTPSFVVIQRLSGADIFRAVDIEMLKPDDPPPVNIKCLPGTNRRPIRPWQLMSLADQELELAVACNLDMIWDLAVGDCVEVPAPEDRMLGREVFPIRRRIWDEFREWYAGDEETNKVPGQGIPTLARVLFAEEYEAKQVENDDGVMNLMRERNLALPRRFRDAGITLSNLGGGSFQPDTASVGEKSFNDSIVSSIKLPVQNGVGASPSGFPSIPEGSSRSIQLSQSQSVRKTASTDDIDTMGQAYEKAINTSKGSFLRSALLSATLNSILRCRRMNTLKYFWPPAMNRVIWQFLFPRCGFVIPPYSMPSKRYQVFASRSRERYNVQEMLKWYTNQELDNEDMLMVKAEAKGVKLRAYHEWLAKEPERLAYSRMNMEIEDSSAFQRRQIDKLIEQRFASLELKLFETDEFLEEHPNGIRPITPGTDREHERGISFSIRQSFIETTDSSDQNSGRGALENEIDETESQQERDILKAIAAVESIAAYSSPSSPPRSPDKNAAPPVKHFRFLQDLPKEYWYIFEESVEYKYSSGIYNEDEVEEMKEIQKEAARKAVEDALAFERSLHEEKKKRDMEERMRLKREEQDRRLKEGMARRRMIRENLDEIKRQRLIKQEEEMMEALRVLEEAKLKAQAEEQERVRQLELERIEAERLHEVDLMAYEELLGRELLVRKRELRFMEHEDITSFLREQLEIQEEIVKDERVDVIAKIYEPFQPYQFKQSRIKRPALHSVLSDDHDVHSKDAFLEGVRNSLHSNSGFRSYDKGLEDTNHQYQPVKSSASTSSSFGDETYFHFLALQEHETESASRHRSKRYDMIYGDTKPSAELDAILASRGMTSHMHTSHHPQSIHGSDSQFAQSQNHSQIYSPFHRSRVNSATGDTISSPKRGNNLLYRELGHSPTKKQVRDLVGTIIEDESALPFNPYNTEWEIGDPYKHIAPILANNVPVAASIPYFSRPSTRGGLAASGPSTPGYRSPGRRCQSPRQRGSGFQSGTLSPHRLKDDNIGRSYDGDYSYGDGEYEMDEEGNIWYNDNGTGAQRTYPINISLDSTIHAPTDDKIINHHSQSTSSSGHRVGSLHHHHHSLEDIREESVTSESLFHSQDSSVAYEFDDSNVGENSKKKEKEKSGRKKMKELLGLSADVIAQTSQQEWLDFLATQKKLTMASLVSLDARSHAREMNPILASLKAQQRAAILSGANTVQDSGSTSSDIHHAPSQVSSKVPQKKKLLLKKEDIMSQSAPTELSLVDSKTRKLGKSASEAVIKLQQQRAAIRQYVSGNAILGDNYFLDACQPGIRNITSLEANEEVRKFAEQLQHHLQKEPHDNHHSVGVINQDPFLQPSDSVTPKSAGGKDKKTLATSLTSLTASEAFLPVTALSTTSKVSLPLQPRLIPSKSSVSALVTGSTMKIEKDINRKRLKPIGPQKSASSSALPPHSLSLLNDPLVASALNSESMRPSSSERPTKSIELAIRTPDKNRPSSSSRDDPFRSSLSLDSRPLPPIKG